MAALVLLPLLFGGFGLLVSGISPRPAAAVIASGGFVATALLLIGFTRIGAVVPAMAMMGLASFYQRPCDFAGTCAWRSRS